MSSWVLSFIWSYPEPLKVDIDVECMVQTLHTINIQRRESQLADLGVISWSVLEVAGKIRQDWIDKEGR